MLVRRAYADSYALWIGLGLVVAGIVLLVVYLVTGGSYPLPTVGAWNLAFPVGCLVAGTVVTVIGLVGAARANRDS